MKSAYELAMERLEKESGPAKKLSDEQRDRIAEIDKKYEAEMAETRLNFETRLSQAASHEERQEVQQRMVEAMNGLEAERDQEKDAVWADAPES